MLFTHQIDKQKAHPTSYIFVLVGFSVMFFLVITIFQANDIAFHACVNIFLIFSKISHLWSVVHWCIYNVI